MNQTYGVPRDIYARIKIYGLLLRDIGILGVTFVVVFTFQGSIFPPNAWLQTLLFPIVSTLIAGYLIMPVNGGRRNYNLFWLSIRRHRFLWFSFEKGGF